MASNPFADLVPQKSAPAPAPRSSGALKGAFDDLVPATGSGPVTYRNQGQAPYTVYPDESISAQATRAHQRGSLAGAVGVRSRPGSLAGATGTIGGASKQPYVVESAAGYMPEVTRLAKEGYGGAIQSAQQGDFDRVTGHPFKAMGEDLSTVGGIAEGVFAPVTAAITQGVGRPVEDLTRGHVPKSPLLFGDRDYIPKEFVGDIGTDFVPMGGEAKLSAGAKAVREAELAFAASRRIASRGAAREAELAARASRRTAGRGAVGAFDDLVPAAATKRPVTVPMAREKPPVDIAEMDIPRNKFPKKAAPAPPAPPAPKPPGVVSRALSPVRAATDAVKKVFAPTTVSEAAGETGHLIRGRGADYALENERAAHNLVKHYPVLDKLPVPNQRRVVAAIENRSQGMRFGNKGLQTAVDDTAKVYERYRKLVEQTLEKGDKVGFIDDYYAHMWKEKPTVVSERMGLSRQGSGRNLMKRSIPTLQEGIDAGLTPKFENPIDTTMAYTQNMSRYLTTHAVQRELKDTGYAKFFTLGKAPKGWVELDGIRTNQPAQAFTDDEGLLKGLRPARKLYASPDVARVYNRWISKGFESGAGEPFWSGWRKMSDASTQLKLGLSAFHATTMSAESMVSDVARGLQALTRAPGQLVRGDVKGAGRSLATAGKSIGTAAVPLASPIKTYLRGAKLQKQLLEVPGDMTPMDKAIADAFLKGGQRIKMDPFYRSRASGSFFNAMEKGSLRSHVRAYKDQILYGTAWEKVKFPFDLAADIFQTTAAPIFEKLVPALKQGAFAQNMHDFLEAHPNATDQEITKYATKLGDSMDNRFGELVQDNFFWHRQMKQAAQIIALSPTWDIGTVREIGGGVMDVPESVKGIMTGKGITNRTAYVAALAATTVYINAIMTYLKTGTAPKGADFAAYRTGGTDAATGEPERGMTPGYQKDVYAFGQDFPNNVLPELSNKLQPFLKETEELIRNRDFRNLPIRPEKGANPQPGDKGLGSYLVDQNLPISVDQLMQGRKEGSNLSPVERGMAIRPAPRYITAPDVVEHQSEARNRALWEAKRRADAKAAAQREGSQ